MTNSESAEVHELIEKIIERDLLPSEQAHVNELFADLVNDLLRRGMAWRKHTILIQRNEVFEEDC